MLSKLTKQQVSIRNGLNMASGPLIQKRNLSLSTLLDPVVASSVVASMMSFAGLVYFTLERYKVSNPDQYLVRTGLGITDVIVSKQGYQWPLQKYNFIHLHPTNYSFELSAMSSEKLEFVLPAAIMIGRAHV